MSSSKKILERDQRFSESLLWKLQNDAYCQFGIEAWNQYGVPAYITSNPFTAKNYAAVVLGYLRDCFANGSLDLNHPLYLFDLGAGTGRFAYFFLKELLKLLEFCALPKLKICYVMTDIASANLRFWQEHPYLKPFFDQGVLDCAYFHHEQTQPIHLLHAKKELQAKDFINPVVLLCNYFFDTIPQDLFRFKNKKLEEGRITLFVENEEQASGPSVINRLQWNYTYHPIENVNNYYKYPGWNLLLESYAELLEGHSFLFPIGAFSVIQNFMDWSQARLLLLAGDQGFSTEDQLKQAEEPKLSLHGSFSLPVSYHAIARFLQMKIDASEGKSSGTALLTSFSDAVFTIIAGAIGKEKETFGETQLAFGKHLDDFEPVDYFKLVSLTEEEWKDPPLEHLLLLMKLGYWDGSVLLTFFSIIRQKLPAATEIQKRFLQEAIDRLWENFYPTGPSTGDFPLNLGVLLFEMKAYAKAIVYFEHALAISGAYPKVLKNISTCYRLLGDHQKAETAFKQALLLEKDSESSQT